MTQKTANSVKHLALLCFKAIQTIAGERVCPKCRGAGIYQNCSTCNGTGKVGWKWKPKVGEWYLYNNACGIISNIENLGFAENSYKRNELIPILDWEKIEEILEGIGYCTVIGGQFYCELSRGKLCRLRTFGRTRQEAVMRAVQELAKKC